MASSGNGAYATHPAPETIDLTEAIKDSPRFRASVAQHVVYFQRLENRLTELMKHVTSMIELSKNYVSTFYKMTVSINQLKDESFADNALALSSLQSLSDAFGHTLTLSKAYHEQSNVVIYNKLNNFVKSELAKVQEARSHFESMSASMDEALAKNAACARTKPGDAVEGRNTLTAIGACFAHTTLDYVAQINIAHSHKDYQILDALWSFVRETSAFFSKGHAFFDEWTASDNGAVSDAIAALQAKTRIVERKMQDVHSLVPKEMFQHPSGMSPDPYVILEGYLNKRSSNAFKKWNRRWFQIKDNKLLYTHRSTENEEPTVMEDNLMLCLVRAAPASVDRACCFELVTPTRSHLLQADSESMCNAWMRALQRTILALHEADNGAKTCTSTGQGQNSIVDTGAQPSSSSQAATNMISPSTLTSPPTTALSSAPSHMLGMAVPPPRQKLTSASAFEQIRRVPGNERCADCGSEQPKWVSINLGVVLCIECSGVHRSLGVQVSKVRSLTMDSIDAELRDVLLALGNRQVNAIYLAYLPEKDVVPPMAMEDSTRLVREAWIKAKYVERRFAVRPADRAKSSAAVRGKHLPLVKEPTVSRSMSYNRVQDAANEDDTTKEAEDGGNILRAKTPEMNKRLSSCGSDSNLAAVAQEHPTIDAAKDWSSVAEAARSGDIAVLLKAIVEGYDVNAHTHGTTLLHIATRNGQTACVEFLLVNGAKINALDERMNTPLHLAAIEGNTIQVCQLLKRVAKKDEVNGEGKTPLDIAVEHKHADIVTLLRLSGLRDEFDEYNNPMDETVDDVISDIARRAANERKENSLRKETEQSLANTK